MTTHSSINQPKPALVIGDSSLVRRKLFETRPFLRVSEHRVPAQQWTRGLSRRNNRRAFQPARDDTRGMRGRPSPSR